MNQYPDSAPEQSPDTSVAAAAPPANAAAVAAAAVAADTAPIPYLEAKAAALLLLMVALICAIALYLMYARGVFEATHDLILEADNSDGVVVGMDLTFSGFPIGRVRRIELNDAGKAQVLVTVTKKDAHWLRASTVFTLERGLVGGSHMRAYTGLPTDAPLADGATRTLLVGDTSGEIPRLVAAAKDLIQNLTALTAKDSALEASMANVRAVTDRLKGPTGALGVVLGSDKSAAKIVATLDHTNALLARVDGLVANADRRVFGPTGVMRDTQATVVQMNGLLTDVRASMKKLDAVLAEAQAIGSNVRLSTIDLGTLRSEVESNLQRVEQLVNEINRKWPFARDSTLKLP
jgi:phospholipid/cholesterol/gamma-HCH transport system substrate-binding protein